MSAAAIEIDRPDDWHVHLRDGPLLAQVAPETARHFGRAIVMPNLPSPITDVAAALDYRSRILAALPEGTAFVPLMTLYLTRTLRPEMIERAAETPEVAAVKFYPKGGTTNSDAGLEGLGELDDVLSTLERMDLPLLLHGESVAPGCDVFDRERVFLDQTLIPLVDRYPGLRIVFEHITTREAAQFVAEAPSRVAATITPQHLLLNRNALFEGGLRPHHYCLPVLKREHDREALVAAATSGDPSFFLGTDSAPHLRSDKESSCGCAGIYSAPVALSAYAEAFARAGAIDRLEGFASHFGADFYRIPRHRDKVRLVPTMGVPDDGQDEVPAAADPAGAAGPAGLEIFRIPGGFRFRAESVD